MDPRGRQGATTSPLSSSPPVPASACPTSLFKLVARLLQSAVACEALFLGTAQLTWFAVPGGGCEDWEGVGGGGAGLEAMLMYIHTMSPAMNY